MRDEAAAAKATTIAADLSDEHGHSLAKPARAGQARQRSCTVQHATAVAALLVRRGAQPERLASAEATLRRHSLRGAARGSHGGAPRCAAPSGSVGGGGRGGALGAARHGRRSRRAAAQIGCTIGGHGCGCALCTV